MNNSIMSNKIDAILNKGISLEPVGVNNWALPRKEALSALDQFLDLRVPVLGGDVYTLYRGVLRCNNDNWYCDKNPCESHLDFVYRSFIKAREYIENYYIEKNNRIYFTFVLDV